MAFWSFWCEDSGQASWWLVGRSWMLLVVTVAPSALLESLHADRMDEDISQNSEPKAYARIRKLHWGRSLISRKQACDKGGRA